LAADRRLVDFPIFCEDRRHGLSRQDPYLIFCIIFVIMAVVSFAFITARWRGQGGGRHRSAQISPRGPGVLAILMYVGGEVSVGSAIIISLASRCGGMSAVDASKYVALFWGGMLSGVSWGRSS